MRLDRRHLAAPFFFVLAWMGCGPACLGGGTLSAQDGSGGFSELPPLPDEHGLAGPIVGTHEGVLIVAGGANFPDGVPWHPTADGRVSVKRYHDRIFELSPAGDDASAPAWRVLSARLEQALAYAVSVSTTDGILVVGGEWQEHTPTEDGSSLRSELYRSDAVFFIRRGGIVDDEAPKRGFRFDAQRVAQLPEGVTGHAGALLGRTVFIVGGDRGGGATCDLLALDPAIDREWRRLAPLPGPPRTHAVAVGHGSERDGALYVFSGRNRSSGRFEVLTDAWRYTPYDDSWLQLGDIRLVDAGLENAAELRCIMAGTGLSFSQNRALLFGGARGDVLLEHENELPAAIAAAEASGDSERVALLRKRRDDLYDFHAGFSRSVLAYTYATDRWTRVATFPATQRSPTGPRARDADAVTSGLPVTTTAVRWQGRVVLPSGEVAPGVRSSRVWSWAPSSQGGGFGALNWAVLCIYLASLVALGFWFARRERSSEDFFLGGKRIPWWASGLSIFGTQLSAITYLSIPATSFDGSWSRILLNFGIVVISPIVAFCYLPMLRKGSRMSAYEYLEARFSLPLRLFGSASFILFQVGRMAVVVLLPALALSAVTGIEVWLCIVTMGILSTLYTVLGGIEAVIWTDVIQVVVLLGGAVVAVGILVSGLGDLSTAFTEAHSAGKLDLVSHVPSGVSHLVHDGLLVIVLHALLNNLLPYTSDQAVVQRYLAVESERAARKALFTNAFLTIPGTLLFFAVGTGMWMFYRAYPERLESLEKADQIFPFFIATEVPAGLAGLIIAGVFAAAMSSLDSSMHSIATAATTDWWRRFRPGVSEEAVLRFARLLTVLLGVLGTLSAILLSQADLKHLWEVFLKILGLLLGTLGGLFTLGIFCKRAHSVHAWIGVFTGIIVLTLMANFTDFHGLLNGAVGLSSCVLAGVLASFLLPGSADEGRGLALGSSTGERVRSEAH